MDELHDGRPAGGADPPGTYSITDASPAPGVAVLVLEGELDIVAAPELRARIDAAPADDALVVDLAAVTFVDSSVLREFLRARGRLVLAGATEPVRRLLDLTQTGELFELESDADTAIKRLSG